MLQVHEGLKTYKREVSIVVLPGAIYHENVFSDSQCAVIPNQQKVEHRIQPPTI